MSNVRKQIFAVVLTIIAAVLFLFAVMLGLSGSIEQLDDYKYSYLNLREVSIDEYRNWDTIVEIPYDINGREVTQISDFAFKDCKNLEAIYIGYNVSRIGKNAFEGCENLKKIVIMNQNVMIEDSFNGLPEELIIYGENYKDETTTLEEYAKGNGIEYKDYYDSGYDFFDEYYAY